MISVRLNTMALLPAPSERSLSILGRAGHPLLHSVPSPTTHSSALNHPQHRFEAFRFYATQLSDFRGFRSVRGFRSSTGGFFYDGEGQIYGTSSSFPLGRGGCEQDATFPTRRNRLRGCVCKSSGGSGVGSKEWMSKATPYEVLGVSMDCSEDEIKAAFRAMIKEYHPDVYQGLEDADAITQRLLQAYEILTGDTVERPVIRRRRSLDPFEDPECVAEDLFVNELACIGRGCPYSCVERAPDVFQFAPDTGRARAYNQDDPSWKGEYHVQLAVGQCPRNCIHTVTPEQRLRLEEILQSVLEGTVYSGEVAIMDGLINRARFENGRYQPPKRRKPKRSEQWVDWY